jgi:glucose/arabinose dehydrogenase
VHRSRTSVVVLTVAALLVSACGSSGKSNAGTSASRPPTTGAATTAPAATTSRAVANLAAVHIKLTPVATGLDRPLALAVRTGDDALYIAEQGGRIVALVNGAMQTPPVLDIGNDVSTGNEQGLLGITFSRDGKTLYIDYTDRKGDTNVQALPMQGRVADVSQRREILKVTQPYSNHNGGEVTLGPDGLLYVGLGDGGSEGDPNNNGQKLSSFLSKILRIDPDPQGASPYSVPADNPFVKNATARPETWMWGLRNPWRFSFDRANGDLWIGDVGQNLYEEIDDAPAGETGINWGWSRREGFHKFKGARPPGGRDPILELDHSDGFCAVVGGYVYRGEKIPALDGVYLYSDNCKSDIDALTHNGTRVTGQRTLVSSQNVTSFGEDAAGELYVISRAGTVYRIDNG